MSHQYINFRLLKSELNESIPVPNPNLKLTALPSFFTLSSQWELMIRGSIQGGNVLIPRQTAGFTRCVAGQQLPSIAHRPSSSHVNSY